MAESIGDKITRLALLQKALEVRQPVLEQMRQGFFDAYVKPYDDELAAAEMQLIALEAEIKKDALEYVQSTGDVSIHPSLTFRRAKKLMYDKDEVVLKAQAIGAAGVLRIKTELDVKKFEADWRAGKAQWAEVEEVPAPTIALAKLGDIVIMAEMGE